VTGALERADVLFDAATVNAAVDRLAVRLTVAFAEKNPLLVCVMNGGVVFTGALMLRLIFPLELTYVHVSRYRGSTRGGELTWNARPSVPLAGRHVLFVDDILDRGVTLSALEAWAAEGGAASVTSAVLLDKAVDTPRSLQAEFAALKCPDRYVFGWGMDYEGYWRNLPEIRALPLDLEGS
jgi:hypoxanthine phosphoribosyltransferase